MFIPTDPMANLNLYPPNDKQWAVENANYNLTLRSGAFLIWLNTTRTQPFIFRKYDKIQALVSVARCCMALWGLFDAIFSESFGLTDTGNHSDT